MVVQILGFLGAALSIVGAYKLSHADFSGYGWFLASGPFLFVPLVVARPLPWPNIILLTIYLAIDIRGFFVLVWGKHGSQ
jgi:hypothetical protein